MQCAITPNRRGKPCVAYSLAIASLSGSVTYSISRLWYLPPMAFRASLISFKACCEKYIYPFRRAYLTRLVTGFLGVSSRSRHPDVETNRRHSLHGPVLRIGSPTVTMAPTCRWRSRPQHQKRTKCIAANSALFDHFVSQQLHRNRYVEAKRPGRLHVDDQLELGRLHDRQISVLLAPENPAGQDTCLTVSVGDAWPIAHQAAGSSEFSKLECRRNRITSRQGSHLIKVAGK